MTPRRAINEITSPKTPVQTRHENKTSEQKSAKQNGASLNGNKTLHKEKKEQLELVPDEASQKAGEKILYLFSSEHRASLRREEQDRQIETQNKALHSAVH